MCARGNGSGAGRDDHRVLYPVLRWLAAASLIVALIALTVWMAAAAAAPMFDPSLVPGPGLPPSRAPHP